MITNIKAPELIIILPRTEKSETGPKRDTEAIRFAGKRRSDIAQALREHHVAQANAYAELYAKPDGGSLDSPKLLKLLEMRNWSPKHSFSGPDDLDALIDDILKRLNEDSKTQERGFHALQEVEDPNKPKYAGWHGPVPKRIQEIENAIEAFLAKHAGKTKQRRVSPRNAEVWINGLFDGKTLRQRLKEVVKFAKSDSIIFHEPHHDLTPGMLLIDEIFRAMVSEVGDLIRRTNERTEETGALDTTELEDFVDGLVNGVGDSNKFGTFILPAGPLPGTKGKYHVDPTRIELFLDGDRILASSVIVGAWKGGTHSAGHTS